jgi:hypothetical protein
MVLMATVSITETIDLSIHGSGIMVLTTDKEKYNIWRKRKKF